MPPRVDYVRNKLLVIGRLLLLMHLSILGCSVAYTMKDVNCLFKSFNRRRRGIEVSRADETRQ